MRMIILDEYVSDIVDPFSEESITQDESQQLAYLIYQQDVIIESIGNSDNKHNLKLFLNDILKFDKPDIIKFLKRCFVKLNSVYSLDIFEDVINHLFAYEDFEKSIIPLLNFFELDDGLILFANCFPYTDLSVLRNKELFSKFVTLNYDDFLKILNNKDNNYPGIIRSLFNYSSLNNSIEIFWKIVSNNIVEINSLQLLKGD